MSVPATLRRSDHLSWFAHMGAVYLFHDLYGYLMEMSPDIAELIEAFGSGADTAATIAAFAGRFEGADPAQFVDVLSGHAVLVEPDERETESIFPFVPIKAKWNIWERRGERLCLWTAWGDRPVTQVMLDPEETAMWDAFDGEKRLAELRGRFDAAKLGALARRLVHSDVQALKLSMMPWSQYAKRPGLAPPYLTSTMPYARWRPGEPVPAAADLAEYHHAITDADAQFDHHETTLSHLLRVPHPALAGRSYGQALVDALRARGAMPHGRVRVLEIGAGLGYVARDAIAHLGDVDYTIVELSPALAAAQRERIGNAATWVIGDALDIALDRTFDIIISNEMVGDLPARQMTRAEAPADLPLVDAPETFYLQTGALALIARIARWLAPGGTAIVTEFGEINVYPKLSTHLDHPELSTHFGLLQHAARTAGLDAKIEFVIDVLDFDRTQRGLTTTRSQFRALRALAADHAVDLPKIGYTPELLAATIGDKLDLAQVGDLRFDKIEDRLMGLVPHEFKALIASKPR